MNKKQNRACSASNSTKNTVESIFNFSGDKALAGRPPARLPITAHRWYVKNLLWQTEAGPEKLPVRLKLTAPHIHPTYFISLAMIEKIFKVFLMDLKSKLQYYPANHTQLSRQPQQESSKDCAHC